MLRLIESTRPAASISAIAWTPLSTIARSLASDDERARSIARRSETSLTSAVTHSSPPTRTCDSAASIASSEPSLRQPVISSRRDTGRESGWLQ